MTTLRDRLLKSKISRSSSNPVPQKKNKDEVVVSPSIDNSIFLKLLDNNDSKDAIHNRINNVEDKLNQIVQIINNKSYLKNVLMELLDTLDESNNETNVIETLKIEQEKNLKDFKNEQKEILKDFKNEQEENLKSLKIEQKVINENNLEEINILNKKIIKLQEELMEKNSSIISKINNTNDNISAINMKLLSKIQENFLLNNSSVAELKNCYEEKVLQENNKLKKLITESNEVFINKLSTFGSENKKNKINVNNELHKIEQRIDIINRSLQRNTAKEIMENYTMEMSQLNIKLETIKTIQSNDNMQNNMHKLKNRIQKIESLLKCSDNH